MSIMNANGGSLNRGASLHKLVGWLPCEVDATAGAAAGVPSRTQSCLPDRICRHGSGTRDV
jgi:hypothetical protein